MDIASGRLNRKSEGHTEVIDASETDAERVDEQEAVGMFRTAMHEADSLGYKLHTEIETDVGIAEGILRTAHDHNARAIVLGHPHTTGSGRSTEMVESLVGAAECPVVVVKFAGPLAGGRILLPLTDAQDLDVVRPVVRALGVVSKHTITLLRLMPPQCDGEELRQAQEDVRGWCSNRPMAGRLNIRAVPAESRVHQILEAAVDHDVLVMPMHSVGSVRQALFGSLAREVAEQVDRTVLLVHGPPDKCTAAAAE
ncbi:MAG: universal stress protein [Armatimonadota bacterium]|nr:universal stress protein [Armatimonadota bacterium]